MGKKIKKDIEIGAIRTTKSSLEFIERNKTKGIFYYRENDTYIVIDNRLGKMVKYNCEDVTNLTL